MRHRRVHSYSGGAGRRARDSLSSCIEASTTNSSVTGVAYGETKWASDAQAIPTIIAIAGAAPLVSPERRANSREITSAAAAPIAKCVSTNLIRDVARPVAEADALALRRAGRDARPRVFRSAPRPASAAAAQSGSPPTSGTDNARQILAASRLAIS